MIDLTERTLYVTSDPARLRIEAGSIRADHDDGSFDRFPLNGIDEIQIHGNSTVTSQVVRACTERDIAIVWFTRGGRFIARTRPSTIGGVHLRIAQLRTHDDAESRLRVGRQIVGAKVLNSRTLLLDAAKDRPRGADHLRAIGEQLEHLAESSRDADTSERLMGHEGAAARLYMTALSDLTAPPQFKFTARSRRPPLDPMNALLSFLYSMLTSRCASALTSAGLDPQIGFLHSLRPGRDSLALDLAEEFRAPFVDRLALTLVNRRQLTDHHFQQRVGGAVELTKAGRSVVFRAWDEHLDAVVENRTTKTRSRRRDVPPRQARLLAAHLRGELSSYLPFRSVGR